MNTQDKLAEALRELFSKWLESRPAFRTTVEVNAAWEGWKANTAVAAMLNALAAQAQAHGGEWVMVPREPTKAMRESAASYGGRGGYNKQRGDEAMEVWRDMLATAPQLHPAEPVAWRTFDGEGGYDYRSYEDNETYRDDYIKRNGPKYPNWVQPLYLHPQPLDQDAKDAARYRWLRDKSGRDGQPYIRCDDEPFAPMDYWITAATADMCIDRAMSQESGR